MRRMIKSWRFQKRLFSTQEWERLCQAFPFLKGKRYSELRAGDEFIRLRVVYTSEGVLVWTE